MLAHLIAMDFKCAEEAHKEALCHHKIADEDIQNNTCEEVTLMIRMVHFLVYKAIQI